MRRETRRHKRDDADSARLTWLLAIVLAAAIGAPLAAGAFLRIAGY